MSSQTTINKEYQLFLNEIFTHQEIWLLESQEGMACHPSFEDNQQMCILFWSNGILAEAERDGDFENLEARNLSLAEFMENWLPGMDDEGVVCGLNWQNEEGGMEILPADLLEDLMKQSSEKGVQK